MAMLEVENLNVRFYTDDGVVKATNDLSYRIEAGERFGVVGESGAGKSVTSLALMRLLDDPGVIESGEIRFKGKDLLEMSKEEMRSLRGNEIAMIFQDAGTALNPAYTVGEQIAEAIRYHLDLGEKAARERAIETLESVGIPSAAERYSDYPHQFSGGMQQRAVIAIALSCRSRPDHRRRADDGARRHDRGADPRPARGYRDGVRHGDPAHHPRSRRRRRVLRPSDGDVRRPSGRDGTGRGRVLRPAASVHGGVDEFDSPDRGRAGPAQDNPRADAGPDRGPAGCNFHPRCPYAEESCTQIEPQLVDTETGEPADPINSDSQVAACLAHTGELDGTLDYEVTIRGEDGPTDPTGDRGSVSGVNDR